MMWQIETFKKKEKKINVTNWVKMKKKKEIYYRRVEKNWKGKTLKWLLLALPWDQIFTNKCIVSCIDLLAVLEPSQSTSVYAT